MLRAVRRLFAGILAVSLSAVAASDAPADGAGRRLLFSSQGRTGIVESNGEGLHYLDLQRPLQVTWQPGPFLSDGKRAVFLSMEARRDGPGRPFGEYYTQTPCHLWLYDFDRGTLEEICQRGRLAPFMTPALLVSDDRILVQVARKDVSQIYSMRLDGSDAREFTRAGEGVPYGLRLSPDGRRVAFHLAGPDGYQIWTSDVEGGDRVRVAADPGHLYFGPQWSPDGQWILYVDCHEREDPGHDWADVCIGRADGSEHRVLTVGQAMWFAATYGSRETKGGGSNVPTWTPEGTILFPRRLPDSKVAWEFAPNRPDVDHFNRDFRPELARGGTEIVEFDPHDGSVKALTHSDPPVWDFRAAISPDGREIAFCRAATGEAPALWVIQRDGSRPCRITQGIDDRGADHPCWLPAR